MSQTERKAIKGYVPIKPQEKKKAAALAGATLVAVLFVIHGLTGSVTPKKTTAPQGVPGPPAPSAIASELHTDKLAGSPFPIEKADDLAKKSSAAVLRDIQDPFVQISGDSKHADAPAQTKAPDKPTAHREAPVSIAPAFVMDPVNKGAKSPGLPPLETQPAVAIPAAPVVEPEIKLVGIINGDNPVATVEVNGNTVIAYPGDRLAKGYQLTVISSEGIVVKHDSQTFSLRTGAVLNKK